MANSKENSKEFEEFNLLHQASIRIPKKRFKVKEIDYDEEADDFIININYHDDLEIIKTNHSLSFIQLFGRALARTRISDPLKSIWTFVTKEDLEKTKNQKSQPALFYQIIRNIKNLLPNHEIAIILWQKDEDVYLLAISEEKILQNIAEKMEADYKEDFLLAGPYKNFSEAEIFIQKTLKESI